MALLAKKSGIVNTCPIPKKRSRVLTRQAMIREKLEKMADPIKMLKHTPVIAPGSHRMEIWSARAIT
jgi:hypothetical protein